MNDPILIDECLSPTLVGNAHARGRRASHVLYRGLAGLSDRRLMQIIQSEGQIFVTANRRDFLRLYRPEPLHAGLIIIMPGNAHATIQQNCFALALDVLELRGDLTNTVLEVSGDGSVKVFTLP